MLWRAHIDRMKAKGGLEVEEECPPDIIAVVRAVESTSEFIDMDFGFIGGVLVLKAFRSSSTFLLL